MNQKFSFTVALASALMLTSCGSKLGQFSSDYFTTNPNPLEVVGQKVPATVTGRVPAKFFVKDATVTVTPYLVYNGQETASQSFTFQGEKVKGNAPVISYDNGGTVTIPVSYNYVEAMNKSELELAFSVEQGSKQYVLPRVKVADGVVATAALADAATATPAIGADAFQRVINEKYAADIKFLINQANVRAGELNTNAMNELKNELANANANKSREIKEINIQSYASPDGAYDFNESLAQQREKNTSAYLNNQLKKDKITEFGELTANFTAEDWEGFQKLVSQSDIQDKDLIISVLSMYKDPEQREREIRNLSSVFEQLADQILPQLRYSRITASIDVIGKSDAEINQAFDANPTTSTLSVEEILYAATLTDDNARRMAIYKKATELYPNDYRTWNNLGAAQYAAKDYTAAKSSFQKAAALNSSADEPQVNLGLIALLEGDNTAASKYLGAATGSSQASEALGLYYLNQGETANAVRAFGDTKSNNAALAQILNKDYSKAKSTLAAVNNPDATTYYLMAVLGARTNNESMLNTNLKKAVSLDSSLATRAASDLEFSNFNISKALN
jgi:hypothetical protein